MSVDFCGIALAHPVINGSGTFDAIAARTAFGDAIDDAFPFAAFVSKTITLTPRAGNPPPRLWEAQAGLVNSIGLPNKGVARYLAEDLPELARLPVPLITNVMGSTAEEIAELARACEEREEIAAIELNVSCPNVRTGLDIGADPLQLERVLAAVRPATSKPMIVKLTPNCADVAECARAAQEGGADAVSLINTLRAFALAPEAASAASTPARTTARARRGGHTVASTSARRQVRREAANARARPRGSEAAPAGSREPPYGPSRSRRWPRWQGVCRSPWWAWGGYRTPPTPASSSTSARRSWRSAQRASATLPPPRESPASFARRALRDNSRDYSPP